MNLYHLVNECEILAKEFTSNVDFSHKDEAHIKNHLLYTDFASWKSN